MRTSDAIFIRRKTEPMSLMGFPIVAIASSLLLYAAGFFMSGCTPLEISARNTAAAAQGFLQSAQTKHLSECSANPKLHQCQVINQGVAAQNLLLDAVESYCGWPTRPTADELKLSTPNCQRINSASAALSTAVRNLNSVMSDLKAVSQ